MPIYIVGGFNPFEKYKSNPIISPGRGKTEKNVSNHHLAIDGLCQAICSSKQGVSFHHDHHVIRVNCCWTDP